MSENFETDEDRMIYHLELHRDTISWLCKKLDEKGIKNKRTRGNSAEGDILLIKPEDAEIVRQMIRELHKTFNE
ncbi:hypothetical protein [Pectobacterium colocasium]|uniref:hypothetical protein n=1 Tax=Pectobacterium colocasium TaxID=2878098 RepID=UPI001CD5D935|nr:hypothetical protein [Pectobacterium colocasium]